MIYKYTKCESVIAKIFADAQISEKDMRVADIKEWIFEAVEKIGAPMQYIERESGVDGEPILKVHQFQVPIPDDLVHLTAVAYSKDKHSWKPVRTNNSEFKHEIPNRMRRYSNPHRNHDIPERELHSMCQIYGINGVKYSEALLEKDPTFFIKPGWIVLNRKDGYVKLSYKAIAKDERGYPLIPDLASYQEAIYWYVMMKLNFPKFLKGQLGGKGVNSAANVYTYLQQQWNFYRNQAYAEAMMPTESDMRSIKNEWNKLVPEWDSDEVFFKPEGSKQLNYTDYYYGY